jgi:hypothetical protein
MYRTGSLKYASSSGIANHMGFRQTVFQTPRETVPVFVVAEYFPPFQPPEYDVVKGSGSINS